MRPRFFTTCLLGAVIVASGCMGPPAHAGRDPSCRTGGAALADAYVLANPLYSYFLGELEPFLAANREHFQPDGDAIRCANVLSQALMSSAIQLYDPNEQRRQQELNAQLEAMGLSSRPSDPTPSSQLFDVGMQLSRLARVLPAAVLGDFGPMNTPTNEMEQMRIVAEQVLTELLRDPSFAEVMTSVESNIRQLAQLEHQGILQAAERLASVS
jgi:hypothetical protein